MMMLTATCACAETGSMAGTAAAAAMSEASIIFFMMIPWWGQYR